MAYRSSRARAIASRVARAPGLLGSRSSICIRRISFTSILSYFVAHTEFSGVVTVEQEAPLLNMCNDCAPSAPAIAAVLRDADLPVPPRAGEL